MSEHKSLADFLAQPPAQLATPVASNLASQSLLATEASKFQNDLLELKQVVSKLREELANGSSKSQDDLLPSKQVIGFRLQLATESEQVTTELATPVASKQQRGGTARAAALSPERRREIAMLGVEARRQKKQQASD